MLMEEKFVVRSCVYAATDPHNTCLAEGHVTKPAKVSAASYSVFLVE